MRAEARAAGVAAGALVLAATLTAAAGPEPAESVAGDRRALERALLGERGAYQHYFGALWLGRGLRFNNPYRLETPLGDRYESLSLSAPYAAVSVGATFGDALAVQHGVNLQLDYALSGITQEVLTPAYLAQWRVAPAWSIYARLGTPIVLEPDLNLGLELGGGVVWHWRAGLGLCAELVGSLFYGAATLDTSVTMIPMASLQLGARVDYEVLP